MIYTAGYALGLVLLLLVYNWLLNYKTPPQSVDRPLTYTIPKCCNFPGSFCYQSIVNKGSFKSSLYNSKCLTIAVIGGSISTGTNTNVIYWKDLTKRLNDNVKCNSGYKKHTVKSYAVGGRGSSYHLSKLHTMDLSSVDILLVDVGVNDVSGEPKFTELIIRYVHKHFPHVSIIWCWISARHKNNRLISNYNDTIDIIRYYDIPAINMRVAINNDLYFKTKYLSDRVHPNTNGHKMISCSIYNLITTRNNYNGQSSRNNNINPLVSSILDDKIFIDTSSSITHYKLRDERSPTLMAVSFKRKSRHQQIELRNNNCMTHKLLNNDNKINLIQVLTLHSWNDVGVVRFELLKAERSQTISWYLDRGTVLSSITKNLKWHFRASEFKFITINTYPKEFNDTEVILRVCTTDTERVQVDELFVMYVDQGSVRNISLSTSRDVTHKSV